MLLYIDLVSILLAVLAFFFLLNVLYKRTNSYNNQFVDVRKYWKQNLIIDNLQIINVGSNHPRFAFDYTEAGVSGENCAIGQQPFEYDFAILRRITPPILIIKW